MALCDFCNDGITEATHTTAPDDHIVNMCYACMTAFVWGQSSPKSQVLRLSDENEDEENWVAIRIFFSNSTDALIHARKGEDPEDEIAEWCNWHGVPYNSVADFAVVERDHTGFTKGVKPNVSTGEQDESRLLSHP